METYYDSMLFDGNSLALIPGPKNIEWTDDSQSMDIDAHYTADKIRTALLAYSFTQLPDGTTDDIHSWRFRWSAGDRYITLNMTTFDGTSTSPWGGSNIVECHCFFSDVLNIWMALRKSLPCIWLHDDDCTVYSIRAFVREFAMPRLGDSQNTREERERLLCLAETQG